KVLIVEDRPGRSSQSRPSVSPAQLRDPQASPAWFLDALVGPRSSPGRPRGEKPLPIDTEGFSENLSLSIRKTPPHLRGKPLPIDGETTLAENTLAERERALSDSRASKLPYRWTLPESWRQQVHRRYVATDKAITRSAVRFLLLKGDKPRTEECWLKEWEAWC